MLRAATALPPSAWLGWEPSRSGENLIFRTSVEATFKKTLLEASVDRERPPLSHAFQDAMRGEGTSEDRKLVRTESLASSSRLRPKLREIIQLRK